jgi:hypothetical protein
MLPSALCRRRNSQRGFGKSNGPSGQATPGPLLCDGTAVSQGMTRSGLATSHKVTGPAKGYRPLKSRGAELRFCHFRHGAGMGRPTPPASSMASFVNRRTLRAVEFFLISGRYNRHSFPSLATASRVSHVAVTTFRGCTSQLLRVRTARLTQLWTRRLHSAWTMRPRNSSVPCVGLSKVGIAFRRTVLGGVRARRVGSHKRRLLLPIRYQATPKPRQGLVTTHQVTNA